VILYKHGSSYITSEEYVELIKIYGSSALEIIDISDPANPVHAGKIRM